VGGPQGGRRGACESALGQVRGRRGGACKAWERTLPPRAPPPAGSGRNVYCRYDYEGVEGAGADALMAALRARMAAFAAREAAEAPAHGTPPPCPRSPAAAHAPFPCPPATAPAAGAALGGVRPLRRRRVPVRAPPHLHTHPCTHARTHAPRTGELTWTPWTGPSRERQGLRFIMADGSRVVSRLSGTVSACRSGGGGGPLQLRGGVSGGRRGRPRTPPLPRLPPGLRGATVRVYIEAYEPERLDAGAAGAGQALAGLVRIATLELAPTLEAFLHRTRQPSSPRAIRRPVTYCYMKEKRDFF